MSQSPGIFPTSSFIYTLEERFGKHLTLVCGPNTSRKEMATFDIKKTQSITEQHEFVGKMVSDRRKTKKPLMEKLRRDRINSSLNEMKILVLESLNKDVSRYSKMEKADILEMTVKFLREMNSQSRTKRAPLSWTEYRSGYNQCSLELIRNMSNTTAATPLQRNEVGHMHGKVFAHLPVGFHSNTHVNSNLPPFILPNSTVGLHTSPVNLTTGKPIPAVVWVPIPSPPPSPSNKATFAAAPPTSIKNENIDVTVTDTQEKGSKIIEGDAKTKSTKSPTLPAPTMWRPW